MKQRYFAETIATFCLIFAGTGSIIVEQMDGGKAGLVGIAIVWGLIVLTMIYGVGHISGAHMNPAVTLGFYAGGRLTKKEILPYLASQFAGAVAASALLRVIFAGADTTMGITLPAGSALQSLILETAMTFMLMFLVMAVATDHRAQGVMAGVAVGGMVTLLVIFGGPISGTSLNPTRSIAPALVSGNFSHLWIYIAGPIAGAVLGAWAYNAVREAPAR